MAEIRVIRPQEGYQMEALSSSADIVVGGASAGVGKTFTLLLDPLPDIHMPGFGAVIFRRTNPQIRNEGGLWDTSKQLYPHVGAVPRESTLEWIFPKGPKVKFSHLEYEKNIFDWQGSQIPLIGFDELTHFTKKMFFYLLTRNRSVCGVKPRVRATCNPDPDSWVAELISWWIDPDTGFPIREREGILRYFIVNGDNYIWGNTKDEVIEKGAFILDPVIKKSGLDPNEFIKSLTFISGDIYQNKELLSVDPAYLGNLLAQDEATQSALLHGNWKVILSDNDVYNYHAFLGMFNNKFEVEHGERYITADIAMKGSNKLIILGWDGWEVVDIMIIDKSNGKLVITSIEGMASRLKCQNRFITFDNDGVGSFVDGFIEGALEFNNGGTPYPNPEKPMTDKNGKPLPENYFNIKTQCYYRSGDNVALGKYRISEDVANTMYDDKMTVRQRFMYERKAIKQAKKDFDGKLKIIGKDEMKTMLNGDSPDLMDAFMMREIFNLHIDQSDEWVPY
jgi:hypothetical protein